MSTPIKTAEKPCSQRVSLSNGIPPQQRQHSNRTTHNPPETTIDHPPPFRDLTTATHQHNYIDRFGVCVSVCVRGSSFSYPPKKEMKWNEEKQHGAFMTPNSRKPFTGTSLFGNVKCPTLRPLFAQAAAAPFNLNIIDGVRTLSLFHIVRGVPLFAIITGQGFYRFLRAQRANPARWWWSLEVCALPLARAPPGR